MFGMVWKEDITMSKPIRGPILAGERVYADVDYLPLTGWKCSVCFQNAQVTMCGETLCLDHACRYKWGYGETLKAMSEELK